MKITQHLLVFFQAIFIGGVILSEIVLNQASAAELVPEVERRVKAASVNEEIPVIIRFTDRLNVSTIKERKPAKRRARIVRELKLKSYQAQKKVRQRLQVQLSKQQSNSIKHLWMINAISAKLPANIIKELSEDSDVESISLDAAVAPITPEVVTTVLPEWNLTAIAADSLWSSGFTGQGVVIGTMDTGVDVLHQDLASRWRGGTNSWFDPYGEHINPYDADGHGTQIMGVTVGGSAGGSSIGVAPDAKWIAAKIFNDQGVGTVSAIHQGFQWMLDPDNNPDTDDAPDIINNAWNLQGTTNTCNTEFQMDIDVLRNANIALVFSAGNTGPNPSSSISPANNSGSFEVGSVDDSLNIVYSSARGPSACDAGIYPQVVAPGFNIYTSDLTFGGVIPDLYTTVSGTSFAAAHVSGAMALLKSAVTDATVDQIESALRQSALDVGVSDADNDSGWGVINIAAAYQLLQNSVIKPVADHYSMQEDTSLIVVQPGVLANDTGSGLSAMLVGSVSSGQLVFNVDGSFNYTPDVNFNGTVSFEYITTDGTLSSNPAVVTIDVVPVNDSPVANNDYATTIKKKPVNIDLLANDFDIDNQLDPASLVIVTQASRGLVVVNNNGSVTYTSSRFRAGTDTFSYRVSDVSGAESDLAEVRVDIFRR